MAKKFGNTWWGQQWLNALTQIDFGNRLPRGARYARNGSVRSIEINGGKIAARVAGSRPTPYKEALAAEQFDAKSTEKFIGKLAEHPIIMASLMQRKLDPEVLAIARECGFKVFPTSWRDLSMKCSCPDRAVPCKHLAAVIYKLSEEIDNNPFLVFELHGLDLFKELKQRNLLTEATAQSINPMPIEELLALGALDKNPAWVTAAADFSLLPNVGDELISLLADNPPFSTDGDFKKAYARQLGIIAKNAAKAMNADTDGLKAFPDGCEIAFELDKNFNLTVKEEDRKLAFADFVVRLGNVDPATYLTSEPWVEALHKMWLLAANLLWRRLVVPRIVAVNGAYRIIWQPATLHAEVKRVTDAVTSAIPSVVKIGRKALANSGEWLLWGMLGSMMSAPPVDSLSKIFFNGEELAFDGIGQKGIPGGIKVWTDKFFLLNEGKSPFDLQVKETKNGFSLAVYVTIDGRVPYHAFVTDPATASQRIDMVTKLTSLTDYLPELREYVLTEGKKPLQFTSQTFVPFLFKAIPLMRLLGVNVALPKSLATIITPKISVKIDAKKANDGKSYLRLDEMLTFSWEVALGDTVVTAEEFNSLMQNAGELVKFKGQYIYATPEQIDKLHKELAKGTKLASQEILAIALAQKYKDANVAVTEACRELLATFRSLPKVELPAGLNAFMRPYQLRGYEWMVHNLSLGFGAIIADDMGLGKTLQVIAVLLKFKEEKRLDKRKALIVVPTGLLTNWVGECGKFAPELRVSVYHGAGRNLKNFDGEVLLTSYGTMRSDADKLKKLKWELLVIDEAQNIKNTATAQTKAINSIPATSRIAMSGTPVENRLSEYWSIMNFANKGLLGTLKDFNTEYGRPIQLEGNMQATERFRAITAPFMLRRLKSDKSIISDLPDKIERDEYAALTPQQSALYQETLNEAMRGIEAMEGTDHATLFKRQGLVLQMILALKQICNHPAQFLKIGQADVELSGKAGLLLDTVTGIVESGEKVLIFTQFTEMGELIGQMLAKNDIPSMFYHGGCTLKQREMMVQRFQSQRSAQVFILSIKAAGTGLNLTAASNVIHYDLWWNPAVEAQATDRAYRIGQHSNVQVHRFITRGTFEEKINAMIQDKKQLADLTVSTGEKWLAEMSDKELRSIFTLS